MRMSRVRSLPRRTHGRRDDPGDDRVRGGGAAGVVVLVVVVPLCRSVVVGAEPGLAPDAADEALLNTQAAPLWPSSSGPPIRAVEPSAASATIQPKEPSPLSPPPVSLPPCWSQAPRSG